jgi:hypothetical protein
MPDNVIQQPTEQVTVTRAAGFVVVSWWQDKATSDLKGSFSYDHYKTLEDALEGYDEYRRGEFYRAREMGVFACDESGMPLRRLSPEYLMAVMPKQRSGR